LGFQLEVGFALELQHLNPELKEFTASGHAIHYMEIPPAAIAWTKGRV